MQHCPLRVLIVDDNQGVRLGIREHLEAIGWLCQEAENGLHALTVLRTQAVDVLLTDFNMPDMDGLQLTKTISQHQPSYEISRIVVMSAWITEDIRVQALQAGANAILDKPFSIPDLVQAIQSPHDLLPQAA